MLLLIKPNEVSSWFFFWLFNDPGWCSSVPVYASLMTFFDICLVCFVSNVGWSLWVLQHKIFQAAVPDRRQVLEDVRWRNPFLHWQRRGHYLVRKSHGMWPVDIVRWLQQFAFYCDELEMFSEIDHEIYFSLCGTGTWPQGLAHSE